MFQAEGTAYAKARNQEYLKGWGELHWAGILGTKDVQGLEKWWAGTRSRLAS